MDRLTQITQAGSVYLLALKAVPFDFVQLSVLYEPASSSAEDECHVEVHALLPEAPSPNHNYRVWRRRNFPHRKAPAQSDRIPDIF